MQKLPFIFIFIFALSIGQALACSCDDIPTVDKAFTEADNVVVLKVKSVEKTDALPPPFMNHDGIKRTTLTVEKVYKGTLKVGQEIVFAQGSGADCIWTFAEQNVDDEYLFYLGAKPVDPKVKPGVLPASEKFPANSANSIWYASICSRSGAIGLMKADLLYLENLKKVQGKARPSRQRPWIN